jgi:A/G-specific adenine glycosylase
VNKPSPIKNPIDSRKSVKEIATMRRALLRWYDKTGRSLPWRIRPEHRAAGHVADPYAVWLSEIMLQQTTVPHATPYWEKFLARFPTVTDLAHADRDEVLAMWAGLGYYARARNLHKCAGVVADEHEGQFPKTEKELLSLPGIGLYTAATMAAICFDEATNIVDGNVERVISRIFTVENPLPKARGELRALASILASPKRSGDYGQALMDLGATVCTPRSPKCAECPWQKHCAAYAAKTQTDYPKKTPKKKLSIRYGAVFVLQNEDYVLLERRADNGLLGGMMGFPGTPWGEPPTDPLASAPIPRNWEKCEAPKHDGHVRHIFTHFDLRLTVYRAQAEDRSASGEWANLSEIKRYALPTVMTKVLKLANEA